MIRAILVTASLLLTLYGLLDSSKTKSVLESASILWLGKFSYALHWSLILTASTLFLYLVKCKRLTFVTSLCKGFLTLALPFHLTLCLIYGFFIIRSPLTYLSAVLKPREILKSQLFNIMQGLFSLFGLLLVWSRVSLSLESCIRNTYIIFCLLQCLLVFIEYKYSGVWPYNFMNNKERSSFYFLVFLVICSAIFITFRCIEKKRRLMRIRSTIHKSN